MGVTLFRKMIRRLPGWIVKFVPKPSPRIGAGHGLRDRIGDALWEDGVERAMLLLDPAILASGLADKVLDSLETSGIETLVFCDFAGEPTLRTLEAARKAAAGKKVQAVIAMGGGSVIDTAKLTAVALKKPKRPVKSLCRRFCFVRGGSLPIAILPTTAGTGAEVSIGVVIGRPEKKRKTATVVFGLRVTHVLLDSELTEKLPRRITAACGIDALSHGLEGVISLSRVSEEINKSSMECVRLVLSNLETVLKEPDNGEARLAMARAALLGGKAISYQLAGNVHAFAHAIGAECHIPHGEAIALCLLPVIRAEKEDCLDALSSLSRYCGLADGSVDREESAERLLEAIGKLIENCRFPQRISFIPPGRYASLVDDVIADSINYSAPRTLSDSEIRRLLDIING